MNEPMTSAAAPADTFYDMTEVHEAMANPLYRTSARYRDEVAAKLARSQQAGTVGRIAERITPERRSYTINVSNTDEGHYGHAQPLPNPPASPFGMTVGTFKNLDEITAAMNADSYRDPSYRRAVLQRIQRSIREQTLDNAALAQVAVWAAEADGQGGL